jgi:tetratricopeptide (TPR) repeat protein
MSEAFDAFVAQAWTDHADHAEAVAERLRLQTPPPGSSDQVAALSRLTVHLFGEHLGLFDEARERLDALAGHGPADAEALSALRVGRATLNLAEGRAEPMSGFSDSEALRAEAGAASLCVGRGESTKGRVFIASARNRLAALTDALPADHRPLAVACNNMLWALVERGAARNTDDAAAMVDFAHASREHWSHAGTWLEVERGDYGVACALLEAGAPDEALRHAEQCLASCVAHEAAPYEHFFAHEALARVHRARGDDGAARHHVQAAQAAFDRLDGDDQTACRAALQALQT